MGIRNIFFLYLALATTFVVGLCSADEDPVVTLTKDNFDAVIGENEAVLVEFYATWCGHCKKMKPVYESAARKLKEKGSNIVLAKVDATAEEELADKYSIKGYPSFIFFRHQVSSEYTGGRTEDSIIAWVESMAGPALITVEGDVAEKIKEDEAKIVFVGEFKSTEDDKYKLYQSVAEENHHHARFYVNVKDSNQDRVYVVRDEEGEATFEGKDKDELTKFVTEEWFPHFGPISGDNFKNYADRGLDIVWFCGEKGHYDSSKKAVREVSKKLRSEYSFVWLDTEQFKGHAENALGITEFPGLVCQSKKGRYVFPGSVADIDANKLSTFFDDIKEGKIERSIKSEPIPEKNDELVKVVVAKQFEEIVLQNDKDVFLEIYAPWCGHCKNFELIYKDFAEKVKNIEHVVVAKMDGTANESPVENFEWAGFPTILFVKAGEKMPMKYESGRTVDDLMAFLKKNSSKPIEEAESVEKDEL